MSKINLKNLIKPKDTEVLTLNEYLELCKTDSSAYASPHERLLKAIGEPKLVDTRKDSRLGRLYNNATIRVYDTFSDFYGLEAVIDKIVSFLKYASQGLEEKRQILYLLGPVSGGKSQLTERLKQLMAKEPFYALAVKNKTDILEISPIYENPLGLFKAEQSEDLGIPARYLTGIYSPWAEKRMQELDYDLSKFKVVKLYPDERKLIAISKTEPGDENNQDISSLVGKVDIRKLELFAQKDSDAYSYCGGLCCGNRGVMEFVEMFKAPIKTLHPLLTATQEGNYMGTEPGLGAIPFEGVVIAHSNESEWEKFKSNRDNEAFLDRTRVIRVPYVIAKNEIVKVLRKLVTSSALINAPIAPHTEDILATFLALSRIAAPENSNIYSKMKVYNGEDIKATEPKVKSIQEYRDLAPKNEGMGGISNRAAYGILAKTFNADPSEIAADPVHLFYVIEKFVSDPVENIKADDAKTYIAYLQEYIIPDYIQKLGKELSKAQLESCKEYGQDLFDRYILYADHWIQDQDYRDPETGEMLDRQALNEWLQVMERKSGAVNSKDFRDTIVNFCLRYRATHNNQNPPWDSYVPMKEVIEANILSKTEDLLPVLTFTAKGSKDEQKKHNDFVERMKQMGYTEKQVQLLVNWWNTARKSS